MRIESIPFNTLLGIERADPPDLLALDAAVQLTNHLGTVHASAQLALAEATSGHVLASRFEGAPDVLAVVRRIDAKFREPLRGRILSLSTVDEVELDRFFTTLSDRGRAFVTVPVDVRDETGATGLVASIEWFARRRDPA